MIGGVVFGFLAPIIYVPNFDLNGQAEKKQNKTKQKMSMHHLFGSLRGGTATCLGRLIPDDASFL